MRIGMPARIESQNISIHIIKEVLYLNLLVSV